MALVPDDPAQRNSLLVILVVLAAAYFFNDLWWSPTKEDIAQMEVRLEQLEDQNRRASVIAARGGEELQERLALYERHVVKLEELIPQSEEVPSLLNAISLEARRSDVDLARMIPEPPEPGAYYTRRSFEMAVVGEYHDIGQFLTSIASLQRIITPVDLELNPFQGQAVDDEMEAPLEARFRIQTYTLPPPGGPPGATQAGTTQGPTE